MSIPQLFFSKQARNFDGRHPWVLDRSVVEPTVPLEAGSVVDLLQSNGGWIGRGIYNPNSRIRVRLYQWDTAEELNTEWVQRQMEAAVRLREDWMGRHHRLDAIRLINSEGDGLSGLIVDRFGDYLQVQVTSLAVAQWLEEILEWLQSRLSPCGIHVAMDSQTAKKEGLEPLSDWKRGVAPESAIELNDEGVKLQVDLAAGQKTGYYLDQRANRVAAAEWMSDGSLLDVCCYHAGFSLAACARREISKVVAVDSSQKALDAAAVNASANDCQQIEFVREDCFDYLQKAKDSGAKYNNVVLDPPRMAGSRHQLNSALRAYHRLNLSALSVLEPGGTLVSCSCSGRVTRDDFWGVISSAAKRARRRVQFVEMRTADFDHPIDANCPESEYLKCFICRVH